jgi:thiamine-phosphate pyrophosphorylase
MAVLTPQDLRVKHDAGKSPRRLLIAASDPQRCPDLLGFAARANPDWIVLYRHFGAPKRLDMAEQLALACKASGAALWLSVVDTQDLSLAIRVRAAGVHIPEPARGQLLPALRRCPSSLRLSTSAHSAKAVLSAKNAGFDYAIVSAVFPSASVSAGPPLGVLRLAGLSRLWPGHVIALGGIHERTFSRVLGLDMLAGIACVAGQNGIREKLDRACRLTG